MKDFLISICIPCKNRTYDLKKTIPHIIRAANISPPVEIVVINYGSEDDLNEYISFVFKDNKLVKENKLTYVKYPSKYYHVAHAHNLSVLTSSGQYVIPSCADIYPSVGFFKFVRASLRKENIAWMRSPHIKSAIVCKREEYIASGGYDERFEFYSPGDKDLDLRLRRRAGEPKKIPNKLLNLIYTPKEEKFRNFRPGISRWRIKKDMKAIYEENQVNKTLIANEGKEWGKWI